MRDIKAYLKQLFTTQEFYIGILIGLLIMTIIMIWSYL
jgi:hypothetical protein